MVPALKLMALYSCVRIQRRTPPPGVMRTGFSRLSISMSFQLLFAGDPCETKGALSAWPDEKTPFPVCWGRDCWHPCGTSAAGPSAIGNFLCQLVMVGSSLCPACVCRYFRKNRDSCVFCWVAVSVAFEILFLRPCMICCNLGVRHVCAFTCSRDSA